MFQKLSQTTSLIENIRYFDIAIIDTCFVSYFKSRNAYYDHTDIVRAVIRTYKQRNLNVLHNLERYYLFLADEGYGVRDLIRSEHGNVLQLIDKSINYNVLYRPVLLQRFKSLWAPRKIHHSSNVH